MSTFKKGDQLICVDVERIGKERGYSIYPDEVYVAAGDSYFDEACTDGNGDNDKEIVDLVENGDGEPCTCYDVKFFVKLAKLNNGISVGDHAIHCFGYTDLVTVLKIKENANALNSRNVLVETHGDISRKFHVYGSSLLTLDQGLPILTKEAARLQKMIDFVNRMKSINKINEELALE